MQQSMCLMDVTNFSSKWKIYNVPNEKVVNYSFLLKQKREFQQLINQLKSKVFNTGSCCFQDKICSTACEKDINIYIFDKSGSFKSLHLKVILPKQHLRKKISLLIHLASKNNATSRLQNLCMYIGCKEGNLWETFYNMFAFLLKKSCFNLIGTQFYVSLVCNKMMANELQLLHSLSCRLFNVNSKQTYVKISITKSSFSGIYVQENVPNLVKGLEPIRQLTDDIKGKVEALPMSGQKLKSINVTLKRKFNDTGIDIDVKTLKVSHEFCKKLSCECHERNKWKVFKRITLHPVVNYTDLLKADFDFSDLECSQIHSIPSEDSQIPESLHVYENIKSQLGSREKLVSNLEQDKTCEINASWINSNVTSNKDIPEKTKDFFDGEFKNKSYNTYKDEKYSKYLKEIKQSSESPNNTLVANECKTMVDTKLTHIPYSNSFQVPSVGFKSCNKNFNTDKLSKGFQSISSCKTSVSSKTSSASNMGNQEVIGFQTAAGKSLNISEKAFLAAQKMFEEVCSQEINLLDKDEAALTKNPKSKKPAYPVENYIDNDFNSDFAEKFFEEFPFDDKEGELVPKVYLPQSTLSKLDSKVSQVGKVRKSLGGRRSLKPYSIKK